MVMPSYLTAVWFELGSGLGDRFPCTRFRSGTSRTFAYSLCKNKVGDRLESPFVSVSLSFRYELSPFFSQRSCLKTDMERSGATEIISAIIQFKLDDLYQSMIWNWGLSALVHRLLRWSRICKSHLCFDSTNVPATIILSHIRYTLWGQARALYFFTRSKICHQQAGSTNNCLWHWMLLRNSNPSVK